MIKKLKTNLKLITLQNNKLKSIEEIIDNERIMHAFEDIIIPIITICRVSTAKAIKFKPGLGLKEHNIILSKRKPAI